MVTRALLASFLTVALVLVAVFTVLSLDVRERVRQSVAANLAAAQEVFTRVEARRQQDLRATVATLAENPTLKAALDTWLTERGGAGQDATDELLATVQREANKIADRVSADVLAVADRKGSIIASGGRMASAWPKGVAIAGSGNDNSKADRTVSLSDGRLPRGLGAAATGRRRDWLARVGDGARWSATRASWRTCRAGTRRSSKTASCWRARSTRRWPPISRRTGPRVDAARRL